MAGAAYLVWLGWKLLRSSGRLDELGRTAAPRGGFLLQGLLVLMGNPKALLWFGAFIPQFVDPSGDPLAQIILLGASVDRDPSHNGTRIVVRFPRDPAANASTGK